MGNPVELFGLPSYVGVVLGCFLCGISCGQAVLYYRRYPEDPFWIKALVATSLALDVLHTIFLVELMCESFLFSRINPPTTVGIAWSMVGSVGLTYIITFLVQSFYAFRVWIVSEKHKPVTAIISFLLLVQLTSGLVVVLKPTIAKQLGDIMVIRGPVDYEVVIMEKLTSITCDFLITASMVYFLRKMRSGFRRMESMVNKLMFYSITLGFWTSFIVLADFILFVTLPDSWSFFALHFIVSKCHVNSVLAFLNARVSVRIAGDCTAVNTKQINARMISLDLQAKSQAPRMMTPCEQC